MLAPAPASAGAWIAPPEGQQIWTNAVGENEAGVFSETSAYWEQPIEPRVAFVAAPWYVNDPADAEHGWRAEATVGLKAALVRGRAGVMAVQAGATWRSDPERGCGEAGAELRWLGGLSLGPSGAGFLNVEAAERLASGGCPHQRLDVTLGYHAGPHWLGMAQVFTDARRGQEALQGQLTVVRINDQGRGVQFGVRARLDDGRPEPALVLAFWGRPGD
ncbi:MAG TPA: hypothetical protein VG841_00455 [Caulobacterales bacterium]|nr:hypothetical protein [Caulobacterales bacterium]